MKEIVEIIAKALVDHPEQVMVEVRDDNGTDILELHVSQEDMGKVIGKQGRIAKALRTVVKAAETNAGVKHSPVKIVEDKETVPAEDM